MKMVLIVYEAGIDEDLQSVIDRLDVPGWTKLTGATGTGRHGNRFGTQIWPGTNNLLMMALSDDRVDAVIAEMNELKASYLKPPALEVFILAAEMRG